MVDVDGKLGKAVQQIFAHIGSHLHGRLIDMLVRPAAEDLECEIQVRIILFHIIAGDPAQILPSAFFRNDDRADAHDAEYSSQSIHDLVVVIIPVHLYIDAALLLRDFKVCLCVPEGIAYLIHEGILEQIPVLALYAYLAVLYEKCLK